MGLRIKSNIEAIQAQRYLEINSKMVSDSMEKLSSGYSINKSADDPAGYEISEKMRGKIRGLAQAKRNASDGVSYLEIGESSLSEINNILVRMRELTMQSANDSLSSVDREYLNKEFQEIGKEAVRLKDQAEFNDQPIFTGEKNASTAIGIQLGLQSPKGEADAEVQINRLSLKLDDLAKLNASINGLTQLSITGTRGSELGVNEATGDIFDALDEAMNKIASTRASFGAYQSTLNTSISAMDVASENLSAAQSRIRDVDYSTETAKLAQARILTAAGISVLSQANQWPEHALTLLH